MLRWALIFFVVALVAALFGFSGIAAEAAWVGRVLCFLFGAAFVICYAAEWRRRRFPPRPPV